MDLLQTSKKFGICSSHIEWDIEPANEKCHFPKGVKPKTTCKLVSIFSCCIESYDTAFQRKLICVVQCFLWEKITVFWLKLKISLAKASDRFLTKSRKWVYGNIFEQVFKNDSNLFILILTTLFRFKRNSTFLLRNVENLEDRSVWLEYSSKLLRFKRCCWKETKKFL